MTGPRASRRLSDHEVEQVVGRLLQLGVLIAAIVVLIGGVYLLTRHATDVAIYTPFRGEPGYLSSLTGIVHGAFTLNGLAVVQFGLLLLILTPVLRVAFTLVAFIIQRDRTYIVVTTIVLALLLYGLLYGKA